MRTHVVRLPMAHPGDLSALDRILAEGLIRAEEIIAIIGKTEGNGGVNDFTRGYFTQSLMALLGRKLGRAPEDLIKQIPCVLSGGTEGVLSPHYVVLSRAGVAATARPDDAPFACAQA
jgi:cyanuric acid amidohydrolase